MGYFEKGRKDARRGTPRRFMYFDGQTKEEEQKIFDYNVGYDAELNEMRLEREREERK